MLNIDLIKKLSEKYEIPMEDGVFIALNTTGVDYDCGYDRMRGQLHVTNTNLFPLAINGNESYISSLQRLEHLRPMTLSTFLKQEKL